MDNGGMHSAEGKQRPRVEVAMKDLEAILEHAKAALSEEEFATLKGAMETLEYLTRELEKKSVSIQRLRPMLFGAATETTARVIQKILERVGKAPAADTGVAAGGTQALPGEKPKGHGRNGADAYRGAKRIRVPLETLQAGDACPSCVKGRVYASCEPGLIVRLTGQAPIGGAVYELEKLRCSLCGEVFSAEAPEGVGQEKYDAESAAMIGLLKYGAGLPFHRLERLQENLEIPLPAATQWEIVAQTAGVLAPALSQMIRLAAQGDILHNDDTTMKVFSLGTAATEPASVASAAQTAEGRTDPGEASGRTGVFTSGIVSKAANYQVALFFTGHKHAGENLLDLLRQRSSELGPPIQMCDVLSRNMPDMRIRLPVLCPASATQASRGPVLARSCPDRDTDRPLSRATENRIARSPPRAGPRPRATEPHRQCTEPHAACATAIPRQSRLRLRTGMSIRWPRQPRVFGHN